MRVIRYETRLDEDHLPLLFREAIIPYRIDGRKQFNNQEDVVDFLYDGLHMNELDHEEFILICLNIRMKLIGYYVIAKGTESMCPVSMNAIFKKLLAVGAYAFIVAHNHPSGDPTPSDKDIELTERIKEASKVLGIYLLEHIIVGEDDIYSFKDYGKI